MTDGYTFSETSSIVTVTTTLYGPVSQERATLERAVTKHRVEQLSVTYKSKPAPRERYDHSF
jgi:hypothetical protein